MTTQCVHRRRLNTRVTFVFLGGGDARELGVDLVVLRDLEHGGTIFNDSRQQVRSPRNLKDVFNVRQIICIKVKKDVDGDLGRRSVLLSEYWGVRLLLTLGQLVILLQVAEPLLGGGDVVALVLGDVLLAG